MSDSIFSEFDAELNDAELEFVEAEYKNVKEEVLQLQTNLKLVSETTSKVNEVFNKVTECDDLTASQATIYLKAVSAISGDVFQMPTKVGLEKIESGESGVKEIALEGIGETAKRWGKVLLDLIKRLYNGFLKLIGVRDKRTKAYHSRAQEEMKKVKDKKGNVVGEMDTSILKPFFEKTWEASEIEKASEIVKNLMADANQLNNIDFKAFDSDAIDANVIKDVNWVVSKNLEALTKTKVFEEVDALEGQHGTQKSVYDSAYSTRLNPKLLILGGYLFSGEIHGFTTKIDDKHVVKELSRDITINKYTFSYSDYYNVLESFEKSKIFDHISKTNDIFSSKSGKTLEKQIETNSKQLETLTTELEKDNDGKITANIIKEYVKFATVSSSDVVKFCLEFDGSIERMFYTFIDQCRKAIKEYGGNSKEESASATPPPKPSSVPLLPAS